MGDSERCLPPEWETRETSGLSNEGVDSFTTAFRTFRSKGEEWWAKAELQTAKLITSIQPNPASETMRLAVAAYVTKVIKSCINCEVVKFGSVPLKTYLPDGDVDLTVICPNSEAKVTWIDDVHNALQKEIGNPKSKFRVTQVQLVSPQVKIIKVYIENFLVDVSFDQVGGLCTLCFLEEIDNLIGEDHLFKRSIILVKAWCFYESRLLGANCNLLSSYALEILVIHIFDIFHESLKGPLQVLYLFLEFFSCFDWDSYCVSLSGPIPLELKTKQGQSSTGIKDEKFERELHDSEAFRDFSSSRRERGKLLFTKAFLEACEKHYGLIPRSQAVHEPMKFLVKSLNILDPLRRTNNLGKSVNQGNCARIRRAFVLGARTFRSLLQASEADVSKELDQFFKNCNLRQRPDVGPSSSAQGESLPNGAQKMGCARRSDMAKTEPDVPSVPSQNGGHPASQARLISTILLPVHFKESDKELRSGVHEGASAVESAPYGAESTRDACTVTGKGEVGALDLNGKTKPADSNGRMYHDTLDIDEDYFHVAKTRIPSPLQNSDPILSRSYEEDELSSPGLFSARSSPRECLDAETRVGCARISKRGTSANGNQQRSNGSASSSSKIDSEEDDDSLSQSSLKGEHATASESPTVLGVPDHKRGLLSLSCQTANSESCRNDSSSELQGRPPDPHHSTSVVASADSAPTEVQTEMLRFSSEQLLSVRNEEEREFSYGSVDVHKQIGDGTGSEYPDISSSEGARRIGKIHHQNGTYPSKELMLSSGVGQHGKSKRGRGKERRAQEGGQVGSSSGTAHSPQQASPVFSQHAMHPHRQSSSDATSGTSHFKLNPYNSNATGTGSFRHQFDPGTARMPSGSSSSSHSPRPQYFAQYPYYSPAMHYPQYQHFAIYTPIQNRLPPAKWDGSSGANITNRRLMDQDTIHAPGPSDISVDSATHSLNQIKINEQFAVGVVESLEANGEFATSESFRKTHSAKNGNSHGAEGQLLNGSSSSHFLAGNLKLHFDLLEYGRFCGQSCQVGTATTEA